MLHLNGRENSKHLSYCWKCIIKHRPSAVRSDVEATPFHDGIVRSRPGFVEKLCRGTRSVTLQMSINAGLDIGRRASLMTRRSFSTKPVIPVKWEPKMRIALFWLLGNWKFFACLGVALLAKPGWIFDSLPGSWVQHPAPYLNGDDGF